MWRAVLTRSTPADDPTLQLSPEHQAALVNFDLTMKYGPVVGLSRRERCGTSHVIQDKCLLALLIGLLWSAVAHVLLMIMSCVTLRVRQLPGAQVGACAALWAGTPARGATDSGRADFRGR